MYSTARRSSSHLFSTCSKIRPLQTGRTCFASKLSTSSSRSSSTRSTSKDTTNNMAQYPSGADKLIPKDPSSCEVIRQVTPQITTVSAPFSRFGLFKIGSRATIVKLENNSLAVFSPSALTTNVRATIDSLGGQVSYLAAPDIEHHIFLTEWSKAFPSAKVIGVEGLPEKRAKDPNHAAITFSHVFTAANRKLAIDAAFDREFDVEYVPAHGNRELVFCHRPSRTLIEADLLFHLPAYEQYGKSSRGRAAATSGLATRFFNAVLSTQGAATWHKRFLWYGVVQDKQDFAKSVRTITSWDWDRIVPCHGDVVETGGKSLLEKVMEWQLKV